MKNEEEMEMIIVVPVDFNQRSVGAAATIEASVVGPGPHQSRGEEPRSEEHRRVSISPLFT